MVAIRHESNIKSNTEQVAPILIILSINTLNYSDFNKQQVNASAFKLVTENEKEWEGG